jgi:hypothetical protein
MEAVSYAGHPLAPLQWLAVCRLAAQEVGRLMVWGFDDGAVRVQPMLDGGVRDWIVDADGTTWRRHAARRIDLVLSAEPDHVKRAS